MSAGSLKVLGRLVDARRLPPRVLYSDGWPGRIRRVAQLMFNGGQWAMSQSYALVLNGSGLPAATGRVHVLATLELAAWRRGACVMRGARLSRLCERLGLDASPEPSFYLADADVLVVFGRRATSDVVVHVCHDADRLVRYRQHAEAAARLLKPQGLADIVPAVIEQREVLGMHMLVQQRLSGQTVRPNALSAQALHEHVEAALQPLRALSVAALPAIEGADHSVLHDLQSTLGQDPTLRDEFRAPFEALRAWQGRWTQPAVLVHGDYWLANILFSEGPAPTVSAVLDWERARPEACAGFDAVHLVMFAFAHWRGCPELQVLSMLWDDMCEPVLERLLDRVCQVLSLTREDLRHVALLVWLLHLYRFSNDLTTWNAERRRDWLEEPSRAANAWLNRP
jgi:hypothetical protein